MATQKLNNLANSFRLSTLPGTFAAVRDFVEKFSTNDGPKAVVGTLAAALAENVDDFWSPVLPRGARFNTGEEVAEADLDVQYVRVEPLVGDIVPDIIVSGHAGTMEGLREIFPQAEVVAGNVTAEAVTNKVVAGTLPPHLVAEAAGYIPATIRGFDYSRDGDLAGAELRERLVIGAPVRVTVS